jgi:hypothetical protein
MLRPLLIAALLCAPSHLLAVTVEISTGPIWVNDETDGSGGGANVASFKLVAPDIDSDITWISGPNTTDFLEHAKEEWVEPKFNREGGGIGFRKLTGFIDKDGPGPRGSTTETRGSGLTDVEFTPAGVRASAHVVLTAIGNLGPVPNTGQIPVDVNFLAHAEAKDPLIVKGQQLAAAGLTVGVANVFFGFALTVLDISSGFPGLGQYSTASAAWSVIVGGVATPVLSLAFDAAGDATVTGSPDVSIFLLDTLNSPPPPDLTTAISVASIESLLLADILPDNRLDTPLIFGALVSGAFNFDDSDLGLEAFRVTGDGGVTEPALKIGYVPLPPAAAALLLGLLALGSLAGPRRRPLGVPAS